MTQSLEAIAFAALLGGLIGLPLRASHGTGAGGLVAFAVGGGVGHLLLATWSGSLSAALAAAAVALLFPGLGAWRRAEPHFAAGTATRLAGRTARATARAPGRISRSSPSGLLDPVDRLRIESAVLEAERSTSGEIVVVVVGACAEYGNAGWRLAVALALLGFLATGVFAPGSGLTGLLAAQGVGLVLGHGLSRIRGIRRALIAERHMQECAERRAWSAFAENGLARTADRTGILLFVALLEQRVIVLGDEGVDRVLDPDESWDELVALVLDGVREQRAAEGILAAVRRCGEILQARLPAAARKPNQLPTALILED